ncbi:Rz1-like lysis system protein LysC [Stutzerimonas stutzeri]|uniref:Rz1-like lysis system protein LysC n=1 Tax=Stutzerimonas stutzeri TaxID=316 RepID=UPI003014B839
MPNYAIGLTSCCLLLLAGCASAPQSPEPLIISIGCPVVTPCQLPPAAPSSNGDLLADAEALETAWAECAATVDLVVEHNERGTQ